MFEATAGEPFGASSATLTSIYTRSSRLYIYPTHHGFLHVIEVCHFSLSLHVYLFHCAGAPPSPRFDRWPNKTRNARVPDGSKPCELKGGVKGPRRNAKDISLISHAVIPRGTTSPRLAPIANVTSAFTEPQRFGMCVSFFPPLHAETL